MKENTKYNKLRDNNMLFVKKDSNDHIAYKWLCGMCGLTGYIFGEEAQHISATGRYKSLLNRECKGCKYPYTRVILRESAQRAIHLNNIRRRDTDYSQEEQTYQNI